jgi:hypothetical protein
MVEIQLLLMSLLTTLDSLIHPASNIPLRTWKVICAITLMFAETALGHPLQLETAASKVAVQFQLLSTLFQSITTLSESTK